MLPSLTGARSCAGGRGLGEGRSGPPAAPSARSLPAPPYLPRRRPIAHPAITNPSPAQATSSGVGVLGALGVGDLLAVRNAIVVAVGVVRVGAGSRFVLVGEPVAVAVVGLRDPVAVVVEPVRELGRPV